MGKGSLEHIVKKALGTVTIAAALYLTSGCATPKIDYSHRVYRLKAPVDIHIATQERVQEEYEKYGGDKQVYGFAWPKKREIWVRFARPEDRYPISQTGEINPSFSTFGHEIWHMPELGGHFHK